MDSEADELLFPQVILSSMFHLEMYMRCTVSKQQSAKLSGRDLRACQVGRNTQFVDEQ